MALLRTLAWRIPIGALVSWLGWRVNGSLGLVVTVPLWGVLLARPIIDLVGELRHGIRTAAWRPVQGRHFAYHGVPLQVLEDDWHRRWIRAADVRRIVGFTASDGALALSYPDGWRMLGTPPQPHFSDEALLAHLAKESSPQALKFRHWAERDIVFPARRLRERYGIRA